MFVLAFKVILFLSLTSVLVYLWALHRHRYWKKKNVFSPPATFPLGHMKDAISKNILGVHYMNMYNEYKKHSFVGLYILFTKLVLVNDLELIKSIFSKDFAHFQGHGFVTAKDADPLGQNLFNLEGDDWRRIRTKLTPTFTSSKMKYMFNTVVACTSELATYLGNQIKTDNVIDFQDVFAKLYTDVIGSCAFGIQTNSFKHPDAEFRKIGRQVFEITPYKSVAGITAVLWPEIALKLKFRTLLSGPTKFFQKAVRDTIEFREKNNTQRNDFLQMLIEMKNADVKTHDHMSLDEITAQCFVFFAAGYETSAFTTTYVLLELARNPDITKKLVAEIDRVIQENDGKVVYESLAKMTYLTQVIEETLRIYPPLPFHFRRCTEDYVMPGTKTVIEKGTLMVVPVLGIHRDPDLYPDPMKFDPERFSPENVKTRHQYAYIPFGEGPRICLGLRFGIMQIKMALITIFRNFYVDLCDKTQLPLKFHRRSFLLATEGELFLKITSRNNNV